jgi:hypothetical protein
VKAYYGTLESWVSGAVVGPRASVYSDAETILDGGRSAGAGLRSTAVWAAAGVNEATAIAALRAYKPGAPASHSAIRVYQVQMEPLHTAPVVILEEVQRRLAEGIAVHSLVEEYWRPTGTWHLKEILARFMLVEEEVRPASEAATYIPRWVWYDEDLERARAL